MKNGRKAAVFVGLAGIAVVLVVLYSTSSPPFAGTDATGAIGAVEKHREGQIAPEDVILTDETTHEATQALFADYLADAATLDNVAVELQAVLRSFDQSLGAADFRSLQASLQAIDQRLEAHQRALAARALIRARAGIATMEQMLGMREQGDVSALQARLRSMDLDLAARSQVSAADLEPLRASLAAMEADFEASALGARRLQNLEADLEAVRRQFGSEDAAPEARLRSAEENLQDLQQSLELRAALNARHTWGRSAYLEAISAQQLTLDSARRQFAAAAASLDARTQAAARPRLAELSAASTLVAGEAEALEARALRNLDAQMEARTRYAARLKDLHGSLAAVSQQFEARPQLAARVPGFQTQLAAARRSVAGLDQELGARMLRQMNAELDAVGSYLDHRSQVSARMVGSAQGEALDARSNALRARAATTFDAYLAAVQRDLGARSFTAQQANSRSNLASRAQKLYSHAAMIDGRTR